MIFLYVFLGVAFGIPTGLALTYLLYRAWASYRATQALSGRLVAIVGHICAAVEAAAPPKEQTK